MPKLTTIVSISLHLIWAYFINYLLKKVGLVSDMEFIVAYFVLASLMWKSTIDKLWYSLIFNPVGATHELLMFGLKRREEYVKRHQRKQIGTKADTGAQGGKQGK